jgi:anti-sigma B factor antagonist
LQRSPAARPIEHKPLRKDRTMLAAFNQQVTAFSVAVHPSRNEVVVAPAGELDMATASQVDHQLAELRDVGFTDIVFDLRAVTFIDSSGLHLLLSVHRRAQADGHRFRLIEGSEATHRLFELTGTADVFDFVGRS